MQTAFFPFFIRGAEIPPPRIQTEKAFWICLLIALVLAKHGAMQTISGSFLLRNTDTFLQALQYIWHLL